jgi:hypothetical protein
MEFENSAIDPSGQPEIVGIDNKTAHRVSLPTLGAARLGAARGCNGFFRHWHVVCRRCSQLAVMMKKRPEALPSNVGG